MQIKPNIKSGFGPLTTRGFNALANKVNEKKTSDPTKWPQPTVNMFVAKITANVVVIANRRWKYEWSSAWLNSTKLFEPISGSNLSYATQGNTYAYNTCEGLQQTSGTYDGPGITHANIPTGYTLQPIATGTYVIMVVSKSADSKTSYVFSLANAIDGACA